MIVIIFILIIGGVVGCKPTIGTSEEKPDEVLDKNPTISDYYPFTENAIYDYAGVGNEYAEQKTYFEFVDGNKAQIKVMNPGTHVVKVLEHKDGILREVYYEGGVLSCRKHVRYQWRN